MKRRKLSALFLSRRIRSRFKRCRISALLLLTLLAFLFPLSLGSAMIAPIQTGSGGMIPPFSGRMTMRHQAASTPVIHQP